MYKYCYCTWRRLVWPLSSTSCRFLSSVFAYSAGFSSFCDFFLFLLLPIFFYAKSRDVLVSLVPGSSDHHSPKMSRRITKITRFSPVLARLCSEDAILYKTVRERTLSLPELLIAGFLAPCKLLWVSLFLLLTFGGTFYGSLFKSALLEA